MFVPAKKVAEGQILFLECVKKVPAGHQKFCEGRIAPLRPFCISHSSTCTHAVTRILASDGLGDFSL